MTDTTAQTKGGPPNQGTDADKRLRENKPDAGKRGKPARKPASKPASRGK